MALQTSSYSMTPLADGCIRFDVRAAEFSNFVGARIMLAGFGGWVAAGIVAVLFQFLAGIAILHYVYMALIFASFGYAAYKLFIISKNWMMNAEMKKRGKSGSFEINSSSIKMEDGTIVQRERIHRIILRNSISAAEIPYASGVVIGGTGMVGAGMAVGGAIGNAMAAAAVASANAQRRRQAEIGYRLDVEHNGVATTLAGGMSETTAFGLMTDVGNALGMK